MTHQEIAEMFEEKRRVVEKLSAAFEEAGQVTRITYTHPRDGLELIHIEYPGGGTDVINVTSNSNLFNALEIARQISGGDAVGLIK